MDDLDAHRVPPARLKLVTTLTAVSEAEFATMRDALQVSDLVLSKLVARPRHDRLTRHCANIQLLEPAGRVAVHLRRNASGRRVRTTCTRPPTTSATS